MKGLLRVLTTQTTPCIKGVGVGVVVGVGLGVGVGVGVGVTQSGFLIMFLSNLEAQFMTRQLK